MPPYVKNTGMSSLNELFAMKKNLAYETKFGHQLSGMTKDYFHKKENMKLEIRTVYNELKNIRTSTGYGLEQAQSAKSDYGTRRTSKLPTVYLPPIGIKFMKKYAGIDVKRHSLLGDVSPDGPQQTLDSILNRAIGLNNDANVTKYVDKHNTVDLPATRKGQFLENSNKNLIQRDENVGLNGPNARRDEEVAEEETTSEENKSTHMVTSNTMQIIETEDCKETLPFVLTKEKPLDDTITLKKSNNVETLLKYSDDACDVGDELNKSKKENGEEGTPYNLTERRSSRSTFRGRSSARLPSRSSMLTEYNIGVVALSQKKSNKSTKEPSQAKEKVGTFYLDYGDGKLHDSMEIPKVKDCSRPWCNPHCKTCRNRTFSRPCFVLIPADENVPKRKLPLAKRKLSFPVYNADLKNNTNDTNENTENIQSNKKESTTISEEKFADKAARTENAEVANLIENEGGDKNCMDKQHKVTNPNDEQQQRVTERKRGYSKKRMDELSQPRGGPPAEVRFSKMSLRKKQEELIADERRKALTELERENLANIQGKISMFLALQNEKEVMGKPDKMVDIPVRMSVDIKHTSNDKHIKSKRHRNVRFNPRARLLS